MEIFFWLAGCAGAFMLGHAIGSWRGYQFVSESLESLHSELEADLTKWREDIRRLKIRSSNLFPSELDHKEP